MRPRPGKPVFLVPSIAGPLTRASTIRFEFSYDGGGLAKGGDTALYINDRKVGEGRIERTQPMVFSADETADVGVDLATPVVERIGSKRESRFTGSINRVTVAVK